MPSSYQRHCHGGFASFKCAVQNSGRQLPSLPQRWLYGLAAAECLGPDWILSEPPCSAAPVFSPASQRDSGLRQWGEYHSEQESLIKTHLPLGRNYLKAQIIVRSFLHVTMLQQIIIFIKYSDESGRNSSRSEVSHAKLANLGPSRHLEAERIAVVTRSQIPHVSQHEGWNIPTSRIKSKSSGIWSVYPSRLIPNCSILQAFKALAF